MADAHLRGLPLRGRLPRPARPRLHAHRPGEHQAERPRRGEAVRQLPPLPRLDHAALQEAREGGRAAGERRPSRSRPASRRSSEMSYWDAHKALEQLAGGKAHPVSCVDCHDPQSMELRVTRPASSPASRSSPRPTADVPAPAVDRALAQGRPGEALRPEPRRDPPGEARVRLRPVPRRVLLRQGHDPLLPLGRGAQGRADGAPLRRHAGEGEALQGLDPRRDRLRAPQGAAPRVRDVEPGHPRPERRRPAPTATCRTSARARRRSPTTGCAARCCSRTAPAPAATRTTTTSSRRASLAIQDRHFALLTRAGNAAVRHDRRHRGGAEAVRRQEPRRRPPPRPRRRWRRRTTS